MFLAARYNSRQKILLPTRHRILMTFFARSPASRCSGVRQAAWPIRQARVSRCAVSVRADPAGRSFYSTAYRSLIRSADGFTGTACCGLSSNRWRLFVAAHRASTAVTRLGASFSFSAGCPSEVRFRQTSLTAPRTRLIFRCGPAPQSPAGT